MGLLSLGASAFKVGFGIGDALFNSGKRKKRARKKHKAELAEYNAEKKKAEQEKAAYLKSEAEYRAEQRDHNAWMREQARYRSPQENIVSQAAGARQAADEHGFNPLTLLAYGQGGGSQLGGFSSALTPPSMAYSMGPSSKPVYSPPPPPLASLQAITGDIQELDDWWSGDAERRRQADQLQIDLARVNLDRARAEALRIGNSVAPLGRQARPAVANGGSVHRAPLTMASASLAKPPQATSGSDEASPRSSLPLYGTAGSALEPYSRSSDAEAYEARYGEIAGEFAGLDALIYDSAKNFRVWASKQIGYPEKVNPDGSFSRIKKRPTPKAPKGRGAASPSPFIKNVVPPSPFGFNNGWY